jgi:uncharacterized membrane protein
MFTIVHLHLLLNHLPIIITGLALALLAFAVWRHDDTLERTGLVFLVVAALSALPTYLTGEGAEDAVKHLPGVTRDVIERHSDMALFAALFVGALGVAALWALWRYRRPIRIPRPFLLTLLAGSLIGAGLMAYTGLLGGEIRHTEVRPGYIAPPDTGAAQDSGRR